MQKESILGSSIKQSVYPSRKVPLGSQVGSVTLDMSSHCIWQFPPLITSLKIQIQSFSEVLAVRTSTYAFSRYTVQPIALAF